MIIGIIVGAVYLVGAVALGRWTALRRQAFSAQGGLLGPRISTRRAVPLDEDDAFAIFLGAVFWPATLFFYLVTLPPRLSKQEQIAKLERELGLHREE